MKKYLVIGNPIDHSLSPLLHNYWLKKNSINGVYDKLKINEEELKKLILRIRDKEINGLNVTVPFKKDIISYVDKLTTEAEITQSVNTILLSDNKIVGHNTDILGFQNSIKDLNYNFNGKKVFILGSGGVVPSLIFALYNMKISSLTICNRTKTKAENLKNYFNQNNFEKFGLNKITTVDWGVVPEFDIVINATSIGLKKDDQLGLDFSKVGREKFFYDVIYNPKETNFLHTGKNLGNKTENGKKMFLHQAAEAFKIWHNIQPEINEEVSKLLD